MSGRGDDHDPVNTYKDHQIVSNLSNYIWYRNILYYLNFFFGVLNEVFINFYSIFLFCLLFFSDV